MILHQSLASLDLDRSSLAQTELDIAERVRTNPFPWTGQFSPQLVEQLISTYAPQRSVLLDPFVGSGTSLLEATRLGLAANGAEINPAAAILSNVYRLANQSILERSVIIEDLDGQIFPVAAPLFSNRPPRQCNRAPLERALIDISRNSTSACGRFLAEALIVLCDFHKNRVDEYKVQSTWGRLCQTVLALPYSEKPIEVLQADARALPLADDSCDFVLTSPPYINVQNYHQQYRRSVEALSYDILEIAQSEIGSNRKNRSNRFISVVQYTIDISLALREIARATRPGSLSILVLGRVSTIQGVEFFNGELVAEVAVNAVGMLMERRQERVFKNRYGKRIYEDILHFRSTRDVPDREFCISSARRIAGQVLSATRISGAANCDHPMIERALSKLSEISPSPILKPQSGPGA